MGQVWRHEGSSLTYFSPLFDQGQGRGKNAGRKPIKPRPEPESRPYLLPGEGCKGISAREIPAFLQVPSGSQVATQTFKDSSLPPGVVFPPHDLLGLCSQGQAGIRLWSQVSGRTARAELSAGVRLVPALVCPWEHI